MPYSRITSSRNGRAALAYARGFDNKGHNNNVIRNIAVGSVGLLPDDVQSYEEQMQSFWNKASDLNKNQVRRIILSFSKKELDPDNPASALTAMHIAKETLQRAYPGFSAAIFVQNDGVGHNLHVHCVVCNVNAFTHKGFSDEQTKYYYLEKKFDDVAAQYITLDYGEKFPEKVTQNERRLRDYNHANSDQKYIWKDDLKSRILASMLMSYSEEEFKNNLNNLGVDYTRKHSKKQGDYFLYELKDTSKFEDGKIPANLKSKSYKLGDEFGIRALEDNLSLNVYNRLKEDKQNQPEPKSSPPQKNIPKQPYTPEQTDIPKQPDYDDGVVISLDEFNIKSDDEKPVIPAPKPKKPKKKKYTQKPAGKKPKEPEPVNEPVQDSDKDFEEFLSAYDDNSYGQTETFEQQVNAVDKEYKHICNNPDSPLLGIDLTKGIVPETEAQSEADKAIKKQSEEPQRLDVNSIRMDDFNSRFWRLMAAQEREEKKKKSRGYEFDF